MTEFNLDNVKAAPSEDLITPENSVFLFVDHQPQMFFGVGSGDRKSIVNGTVPSPRRRRHSTSPPCLRRSPRRASPETCSRRSARFPDNEIIDRTTMNAWEDENLVNAIKATGRRKIVISGLWTEVCLVLPVLSALAQGYEIFVVADASGGVTAEAHEHALLRMVDAGAVPVTWLQILLELQRDWARGETYVATTDIVKAHGGAYGLGLAYAGDFLGGNAG